MSSMTVQQDAAVFDFSVRFRLDYLLDMLTESEDGAEPEPRMSNVFWPGFRFKVSRTIESGSKSRKASLRLSLYMTGDTLPPSELYTTVTVQSPTGYIYSTKSYRRPITFEHGRAALGTFLMHKTYETSERMQVDDAVVVLVSLRSSSAPTPRSVPTLNLVHRVLTARPVSPIRFIAFRRRDYRGHLTCPRVFHANMEDLAVHHEGADSLMDIGSSIQGFELPQGSSMRDYSLMCEPCDYDSDFDPNEDDDEEVGDMVVVRSEAQADEASRSAIKSRQTPTLSVEMSEAYNNDPSSSANQVSDMNASMYSTATSFDIIEHKREEGYELYKESDYRGTTIVLLGAAARTWEAVLYYLYTGTVEFAPLIAPDMSRSSSVSLQDDDEIHRPTPPSCRSVYRLAFQLGLEGLRKLALQHLAAQLTPQTLLTEVFSEFTARYEEVKQMELALVVKYWDVLKASSAFKSKMVEVTSGRVPYAADVISEIMLRVSAKQA